jgi:hypothetical protein
MAASKSGCCRIANAAASTDSKLDQSGEAHPLTDAPASVGSCIKYATLLKQ